LVEEAGIKDVQQAVDIVQKGNKHYLVTTWVNGKKPNIKTTPFTENNLTDMLQKLTRMDQTGLLQGDLKHENILLNGDKAGLIDFGFFYVLDAQTGKYLRPTKIDDKTVVNPKDKFAHVFNSNFIAINGFTPDQGDNPYFQIKSNVSAFESKSLHQYLQQMVQDTEQGPEKALKFYKNYLKLKSEYYHKPMQKFLENLDAETIAQNTGKSVDQIKAHLAKAIQHEEIATKILSNPNEEVVKAELSKMQFKNLLQKFNSTFTQEPHKLNSIPLKQPFEEIKNLIGDLKQNAADDQKEYLENTNIYLQRFNVLIEYFEKSFGIGKTALPDDQNLLKLLFKNTEQNIKRNGCN